MKYFNGVVVLFTYRYLQVLGLLCHGWVFAQNMFLKGYNLYPRSTAEGMQNLFVISQYGQ